MNENSPTVTIKREDAFWLLTQMHHANSPAVASIGNRLARIEEEVSAQPYPRPIDSMVASVLAYEAKGREANPVTYVVHVEYNDAPPLLVSRDREQAVAVAKAFNLAGGMSSHGQEHTAVVLGYTRTHQPGDTPIQVVLEGA